MARQATRSAKKRPTEKLRDRAPSGATDDARYSIRVTSRLTAIELDTLRMWERRYGFPRPERTSGGSRVYSESDIECLKLIRRALEEGYRPGEVVGKPREELAQMILVTSHAAPLAASSPTPTIASLLAALAGDDVAGLRAQLRQAAVFLGAKRFLVQIAQPVSVRVGELWADGKLEVRHEHLLSECLSAQLHVLRSAHEDRAGGPRVLLSSLPNERHSLGLEMIEVYLAVNHVTPLFLGADTPVEQIVKAARNYEVDAVGLLVTTASDLKAAANQIRWMLAELPRRVSIWVGGGGGPHLSIRDDAIRIVATWSDLDAAIGTLARSTN